MYAGLVFFLEERKVSHKREIIVYQNNEKGHKSHTS
jgi:hypothetical protein